MGRKGFTIIEVLVAVAFIAIGLVAMMAMQVAFVNGSAVARDTSVATAIGEAAAEQIKAEASMWNNLDGPLSAERTPLLFQGVVTSLNRYRSMYGGFPVNPTMLQRNPAAQDALEGLVNANEIVNAKYCVDVRMDFMANSNNSVIIGQVRVAWPNDGQAPWVGAAVNNPVACVAGNNGLDNVIYFNGDSSLPRPEFSVIHIPFSVRQHNM